MKNTIEAVKQYFDGRFSGVQTSFFKEASLSQQYEFSLIRDCMGVMPRGSKVLDVGGGWGRVSLFLLKEGFDVTAIDVTLSALQTLQNIYTKEKDNRWGVLHAVEGDFLNMREDGEYDAVLCIAILHHVDAICDFLSKAYRMLKKGGVLVVLEPNPLNVFWYMFFFYSRIWGMEKGILNCHKKNIMQCLHACNFNSCETRGYGLMPNYFFNFSRSLLTMNATCLPNMPIIKEVSLFNIIRAIK